MAHRNAASVLPDPVGAMTRVCSPLLIAVQACSWAVVGSAKAEVNHALVASLKSARAGAWICAILLSCLLLPTDRPAPVRPRLRPADEPPGLRVPGRRSISSRSRAERASRGETAAARPELTG